MDGIPAGAEILRRGDLEQAAVVGQGHDRLDGSLAEGATSRHHGPASILEAGGDDLGRACRETVHQYHDGHRREHRARRCPPRLDRLDLARRRTASAGVDDDTLVKQKIARLHGRRQKAAWIPPKIEDDSSKVLVSLEVGQRPLQLVHGPLTERRDADDRHLRLSLDHPLPISVVEATIPENALGHDLLPNERHLTTIFRRRTCDRRIERAHRSITQSPRHTDHHRVSHGAAEPNDDLPQRQAHGGLTVDRVDAIPRSDPPPPRRRIQHRGRDDRGTARLIHGEFEPDPAEGLLQGCFEVIPVIAADVRRVLVELGHHRIHGDVEERVVVDRIDVRRIDHLHHFTETAAAGDLLPCHGGSEAGNNDDDEKKNVAFGHVWCGATSWRCDHVTIRR